jgi:tRNA-specific 2-thiouridylase
MKKERVLVAMSGGVDSSVAALLLVEAGYEVIGVTMRLYSTEDQPRARLSQGCCTDDDIDDARAVCQILGIRHYVMNFEREFKEHVMDYFVNEYSRGKTPHPCLACNDKIKFDFLLKKAMALQADYIATGHYAQIVNSDSTKRLLCGIDASKDQSYVLFGLGQDQLSSLLLPIGGYAKDEIRNIAKRGGLPVADKPDSQDICFIPSGDYKQFISDRVRAVPGDLVDSQGKLLGQHSGIEFFTVGQRKGLGVQSRTPTYVLSIDPDSHEVTIGSWEELHNQSLWASGAKYIDGKAFAEPVEIRAKIRYKAPMAPAILVSHGSWVEIRFAEPQRAITPGQAVVFYQGDRVLGGAIIERFDASEDCPDKAACVHCSMLVLK